MNLLYKVIRPVDGNIGHLIGYACYHTSSDLWSDAVYVDKEMTELHGAYTCENQYHGRGEVTLRRYHAAEPDLTMRWCVICECLVTPPFDGYTYHDYDCQMDESCVCDHSAEGPAMADNGSRVITLPPMTTAGTTLKIKRPRFARWRYYLYRMTIGELK